MHPEVIKYIHRNTSRAGKARWAKIKKEDRRSMMSNLAKIRWAKQAK